MGKLAWRDIAAGTGRLAGVVVNFILPPRCVGCSGMIAGHNALCAACWNRLQFIEMPRCDVFGTPLPYDSGDVPLSLKAEQTRPAWGRARGAVQFDDQSRKIVHALKYHDRHEVVSMMARMMLRAGGDILESADLIVPVPLYWTRLWSRRFNQSALLGRAISALCGKTLRTDILIRRRQTPSQVGLDAKARRENVKGAFAVSKGMSSEIFGRRIVLIDDVVTTGATVSACAKVLKKAGAADVDVLVFALVCEGANRHV
jgi:ComF family protein